MRIHDDPALFRTLISNIVRNITRKRRSTQLRYGVMPQLPEPPRPQRRPRPGRRKALDRDALVAAAIRILDAEGLDAVTIRRVAQELGVGAASLYAYVDSKDALIELVLDDVVGEIDVSGFPNDDPWQEQLKELIRRSRAAFGAHRDVARASLGRIPSGPNALRTMDTMLAVLERSGLSDQVIAYAGDLVGLLISATAYEESLFADTGLELDDFAGYVQELRAYLEALPPDRFPHMVALAGPLTRFEPGTDSRFEFMLDVVVRGLDSLRDQPQAS
jgi:AcrR family transcriptional regulator